MPEVIISFQLLEYENYYLIHPAFLTINLGSLNLLSIGILLLTSFLL